MTKTCHVCGEAKPLDAFHPRKDAKDGRRNDCRECNLNRQRKYWTDNVEALNAKDRADYDANRDRIIQERREFRARERERINAERRADRVANPEKYSAWFRAYYLANCEKLRIRARVRKFRRRWINIDDLIARDGLLCGICGDFLDPAVADIDHIHPKCMGGSDDLSNLRLAHAYCNRSRSYFGPRAPSRVEEQRTQDQTHSEETAG